MTVSEEQQRAKNSSEQRTTASNDGEQRAMTASEKQQQRAKNQRCVKNDSLPTNEPTPLITPPKNQRNSTSRCEVISNYSNDKRDNKKVTMNCGESVGEGGQIPFSDDSSTKSTNFCWIGKNLYFPYRPKTLRIIVESRRRPTTYRAYGRVLPSKYTDPRIDQLDSYLSYRPRPFVLLLSGRKGPAEDLVTYGHSSPMKKYKFLLERKKSVLFQTGPGTYKLLLDRYESLRRPYGLRHSTVAYDH